MATLAIEAHLDLELGNRRLRDGKKKLNKNDYYYYKNLYYIVELTKGTWTILEDCVKTRKLSRKSHKGYARSSIDGTLTCKCWHQLSLNYEDGLVADHINGLRYDARLDNLRVVANMPNKRTYKNDVTACGQNRNLV